VVVGADGTVVVVGLDDACAGNGSAGTKTAADVTSAQTKLTAQCVVLVIGIPLGRSPGPL
jgi:hypothetical protein